MLIRAPHAENAEKIDLLSLSAFLHIRKVQQSAPTPSSLPPPSPYLPFISPVPQFIHRPLCVLQSMQQSAHLENPQLQNSISSDTHTLTHTHTHTPTHTLKGFSTKVLLKPGRRHLSPFLCLKKLLISFKCVSLCGRQ